MAHAAAPPQTALLTTLLPPPLLLPNNTLRRLWALNASWYSAGRDELGAGAGSLDEEGASPSVYILTPHRPVTMAPSLVLLPLFVSAALGIYAIS